MNLEQQKLIAKVVLGKLKALDNRAIIAGGAPRDWYFGNCANDIDIFYYNTEGKWCLDNIRKQKAILCALLNIGDINVIGFNSENDKGEPKENYNNYLKNPAIVNVFETVIEDVKFQFIQLKRQNVDVKTFAYNMCQAWSDGDYIKFTDKFKLGVDKELLIETGELYCNTDKFKRKMISKFPSYTYLGRD